MNAVSITVQVDMQEWVDIHGFPAEFVTNQMYCIDILDRYLKLYNVAIGDSFV